jgi:periplasmic mercuric ion binding protein
MKKLSLVLTVVSILFFSVAVNAQKNEEVKILTSGQCGMCKDRIEKALSYEKGIVSSNFDVETKKVTVIYKPSKTNPDKIRIAISKLGYHADDFKADPIAYENLPSCCKLPSDRK